MVVNSKKTMKETFFAYLYLLPVLLLITVFSYYPFIRTIIFSFSQVTSFGDWVRFIGFTNYSDLLSDSAFLNSLVVTGKYLLCYLPLHIIMVLSLALLTNQKRPFSSFYQTMIAAPMAVSMTVACDMLGWLYYGSGDIAKMISVALGFGVDGVPVWMDETVLGVPSISLITLWAGIGFDYLLLLSAVRGVPEELLENASLAGAGRFRKFYHVTLPAISPTLFFVICTQMIASILVISPFLILTGEGGGLFGSAQTVLLYIYEMGFRAGDFMSGSAASVVAFLATFLFVLFNFRYENKMVFYD